MLSKAKNYINARREHKKDLERVRRLKNFAFFLTFLAVRKYIDNELTIKGKFDSYRVLSLSYNHKNLFYKFIDDDFFNKALILISYINSQEMINNLEYYFNIFVSENEGFFTDKEITKIKFLFNQFESNPKFSIIKILKVNSKKLPKLTIDYYIKYFSNVEQKKYLRFNKIKNICFFLISAIIVLFLI